MSEQKHTPGPKETWMTHGYSVYMNDGNGNTTWICDCKTKELAELIAQAPDLLAKVSEQEKEIADLKAWKESEMKLWGPVLDYAQKHGEELGIGLGESISQHILQFLKDKSELRNKVIEECIEKVRYSYNLSLGATDTVVELLNSLKK